MGSTIFFIAFKKVEGIFFIIIIHSTWQRVVTCPVHIGIRQKRERPLQNPVLGLQFELQLFFSHSFIFLQSLNFFFFFYKVFVFQSCMQWCVGGRGRGQGQGEKKPFLWQPLWWYGIQYYISRFYEYIGIQIRCYISFPRGGEGRGSGGCSLATMIRNIQPLNLTQKTVTHFTIYIYFFYYFVPFLMNSDKSPWVFLHIWQTVYLKNIGFWI